MCLTKTTGQHGQVKFVALVIGLVTTSTSSHAICVSLLQDVGVSGDCEYHPIAVSHGEATLASPASYIQFEDIRYDSNNATAPISLYSGLYWLHFTHRLPFVAAGEAHGISTSSPPFHALATARLGLPTVHAAFGSTGVSFFDLETFSWGCLSLDASTLHALQPETPVNCSLTIQCHPARAVSFSTSNAAKSVSYKTPSASAVYLFTVSPAMRIWGVQMAKVSLGGRFCACQSVTWDVQPLVGLGTREVALVVDDVRYRTYRVTAWDWRGLGEIVHDNGPFRVV